MSTPTRAYLHFTFAPGQCIKDNRDGGSRLLVDTPESDAEAVAFLRRNRDKSFRAVIEVDDGNTGEAESDEGQAKAGRKPRRDGETRSWP